MRFQRHRVFIPAAAVAASTVFAACHRGDSILLVEVAGDLSITPTSLTVTVDPSQAAARTFQVAPKDGSNITLPASLSVEMAPNLTGPVTVAVVANNAGFVIAGGVTTQQDINVGGQTIVVVTLVSGYTPPVDAGSDATSGAGGSGGTGGESGAGGVGGFGGAGGKGIGGKGSGGNGTGGAGGTGGSSGTGGVGGMSGAGGRGAGGMSGAGGKGTGGMSGAGGKGTGGMSGAGGKGTGGSGGGTGGKGGSSDAGAVG